MANRFPPATEHDPQAFGFDYLDDLASESALHFGTIPELGNYLISNKGAGPLHWGSNTISVNISALNSADQILARNALNLWDDIANITIVYTTGAANITYADPANTQAVTNATYNGQILQS